MGRERGRKGGAFRRCWGLVLTAILLGWLGLGFGPSVAGAQPQVATTSPPSTIALLVPVTTTTTIKASATKAPTTTTTLRPTTTTAHATTTTTEPPATIPPAMLAIANSVHRTPPSNTAALLSALAPLQKLGLTAQQAEIGGMGQFPVAGPAYYTDDWLELRPGPPPALHPGIDIVAAMGTPLRSPIDGTLTYDTSDPTGYGLAAIVTGADKTYYLMGHMSATVAGLSTGSAVKLGQVVGFVGSTGNSTGPHCHFEVHPQGGAGVDAKPMLDAWQAAAIKAVPALIRSLQGIPDATAAPAASLHIAVPTPQAAFFPPLPLTPLPVAHRAAPTRSLDGLALAGLLALVVTSALAAARFRPRSGRVAVDSP